MNLLNADRRWDKPSGGGGGGGGSIRRPLRIYEESERARGQVSAPGGNGCEHAIVAVNAKAKPDRLESKPTLQRLNKEAALLPIRVARSLARRASECPRRPRQIPRGLNAGPGGRGGEVSDEGHEGQGVFN